MERLDVQAVEGFVQRRFLGECVLNATQEAIVRAAEPGEVLVVYRTDGAAHGCSWLLGFLAARCGWEWAAGDFGPKHVKNALCSDKDVVIDTTHAFQHLTAKRNNMFRALHAVPGRRVVVMCHGAPPAGEWRVLDVTGE
jgi:hypothetical protein